ncbi:MAG: hypothetical protein V1716_00265 [Candidatus Uhrbacteria bacterium]
MDHQFKRLLNLVRRTGDRLVVTDPNGEDTYVLMGLAAYEKLADTLTPPDVDFLDDFNHDDAFDKYDYYDDDEEEDEYDEKINDFDPNWKIPEEFYTGVIPESNKTLEPIQPSEPEAKKTIIEPPPSDIWSAMPPAGDNSQTWNPESFGEAEKKIVEERFEKPFQNPSKPPQTPSGVVELPEVEPQSPELVPVTPKTDETTPNSDQTDDLGEEQFYLEPVE